MKTEKDKMILDLLRERYSVREFLDKPVPEGIIQEMLEAAQLSPSGGNEQAWAFGVVTDKNTTARIASQSYYNESWLSKAPLIVALCTRVTGPFSVCERRFPAHTNVGINDAAAEVCTFAYMEEHQARKKELKDIVFYNSGEGLPAAETAPHWS